MLRQMHDYASRFGVAEAKSRFEKERVEAGVQLKAAVTEHHQLMQLFKPLLRSLSRVRVFLNEHTVNQNLGG